ncbi:hypothetical protein [Microbacterium sp. TPU 3598]|uniref:hypothetical protein n=1 Tax=Microbacterium sp. TPU 3598 TaxID=1938334 RepID=UPI0012FD2367|nr:hypothetical protein [Microbacterium sp. TPU 3598]
MVVLLVIGAVLVVGAVVGLILHPVQTLRRLMRFVLGAGAVLLVVVSGVIFIAGTKTSFEDWAVPSAALLVGVLLAVLYNGLGRPRPR